MSILLNKDSKIIVQGATGGMGSTHTKLMLDYGTKVVAGVTPNKGGSEIHGVPIYNTVTEALEKTGANVSVIFVPPLLAKDAAYEAIAAKIPLLIIITEGIPPQDEVKIQGKRTIFDMSDVIFHMNEKNWIRIKDNTMHFENKLTYKS